MKSAVGFCGSKAGRNSASACSAQYCAVPSGPTRRSNLSGATNIRLVSAKRPASMRSSQIVNASPNTARVSSVGQMKSAITVPPASTTRSHIQPMRRACSTRSSWVKPRSRDRLARTASALKTTALMSGASALASVVLPAPGSPMIKILRFTSAPSVRPWPASIAAILKGVVAALRRRRNPPRPAPMPRSLLGVFAAAIAHELIKRVDFSQSFVHDPAGPFEIGGDLRRRRRGRSAELRRAGDLIAGPGDEFVEEIIERVDVVFGELFHVQPAHQPVHLDLILLGKGRDIDDGGVEMGPRRRRRLTTADEIRNGAPGRLVVEAFGRDLDMVIEQRKMLAHQGMGLVAIPAELFADRQAVPRVPRHVAEMERRHAFDLGLGAR